MAYPHPADLLVPRPHVLDLGDGGQEFVLATDGPLGVSLAGTEDQRALERALTGLRALGLEARRVPGGADLALVLEDAGRPPETYRLEVAGQGTRAPGMGVRAGSDGGLFHGVTTLLQLVRAARPSGTGPVHLPALRVEDGPDFPWRGFMLDVSRDRVPTMAHLAELVDRLADLKFNQLQLYMEHTFAFEGHEAVWRDASPLTGTEIEELDRLCRARHLTLVPNLQSFGHMHRWLSLPAYAHLAECPDGVESAFSAEGDPFSLCPTDPAALEFLAGLYDQLLPHFSAPLFHVGCDETFDVGRGRSRAACRGRGPGAVALEFMGGVGRLVAERGRRMLYWGDLAQDHPELARDLPAGATALVWGYEAGHPFDDQVSRLAAATPPVPFWVCPGTSSWSSLVGRVPNMVANVGEAARAGRAHGAGGLLLTDWGDFGHWQPAPVSWPGLVVGAGRAWNAGAPVEPLADLIDLHLARDPARVVGRTLVELGSLEDRLEDPGGGGGRCPGAAGWFAVLRDPHRDFPPPGCDGFTDAGLRGVASRAGELAAALADHRVQGPAGELLEAELVWAAALMRLGCDLGRARLAAGSTVPTARLPRGLREALARDLVPLIETHRQLWSRRSRPGGLAESAGRLEALLTLLRTQAAP